MAKIVDTNLAGFTITYNGVQFGGADSNYKSLPPMYDFRARPKYDSSNRAVKYVEVTLAVRCIFYETSQTAMTLNMLNIQRLLMAPRKTLLITGLGIGFGISTGPGTWQIEDIENGPKPLAIETKAIGGQLAWELMWVVQFTYVPCATGSEAHDAFTEFNFSTTWQNDFEGLCTRSINGRVGIAHIADPNNPNVVHHVAEELRDNFTIAVPYGFKRIQNSWNESADKASLEFSIVDQQLEGDILPDGITEAQGSFSFSSGDGQSGGFASGLCTLSMIIKTAPNSHKSLAGQLFLAACLTKQVQMIEALGDEDKVAIPVHLSIANGKFDKSRITQCSMTWKIVAPNLQTMINAAGIWQPVHEMVKWDDDDEWVPQANATGTQPTYNTWKASVQDLWQNNGTAQLSSDADEAVIIDMCSNTNSKTIGGTNDYTHTEVGQTLPTLTCPTVGEDGGWMKFDLEVKILRVDEQTTHRNATTFTPETGTIALSQDPGTSDNVGVGGPGYSQSTSDEHVNEYHGYPETYIGLQFQGLRLQRKPYVPEVKSVGGVSAIHVSSQVGTPKWAFDSLGCPVWYVEGVRVYKVPGRVTELKYTGSKLSYTAEEAVVSGSNPIVAGAF